MSLSKTSNIEPEGVDLSLNLTMLSAVLIDLLKYICDKIDTTYVIL